MNLLWDFLKNMLRWRHENRDLVTTSIMSCLVKTLGDEGLANLPRQKPRQRRPSEPSPLRLLQALCRVNFFKRAKSIFEQMKLPGFRCPPDIFTYTILISSYCRHALATASRKAIRRRVWEANHLFRLMLFRGFSPDVVTYNCLINECCKTNRYFSVVNEVDRANEMLRMMKDRNHGVPSSSSYSPIIHGLCEVGRVEEAVGFLAELVEGGSVPREYTYELVRGVLEAEGKMGLLDKGLCGEIEDGIEERIRCVMKVKCSLRRERSVTAGEGCG
ncbi:pentatricopeptide repeat-containing protein [Striga asiatica]|uniref:Pentatricopeptide repeat-containing protein n=1 Tax=Striga asiatica TaxID=4170 RepID=A0A5A7PEJ0_STRAF|nr:pentatricopeptide repeat-containing protein [Striga asiatica]